MSAEPKSTRRIAVAPAVLTLSALLLPAVLPRLEAGSIFMKNGYIIQGPVVRHDAEGVVLQWPNGKVKIYRRYIESVVYDPGEKERLEALQRAEEEERRRAQEALAAGAAEEEIDDDLPADVSVLLDVYARGAATSAQPAESPATGPAVVTVPDEGPAPTVSVTEGPSGPGAQGAGETPQVEVRQVPRPELGERVRHAVSGLSLRIPQGWTIEERGELWFARGPDDTGTGAAPSLNIVRLPAQGLAMAESVALLEEVLAQALSGVEIFYTSDWRSESGELSGREIAAKGTLGGRTLAVQHLLVSADEERWLVSGFTPDGPGSELFALVEKSLESVDR